MSLSEIGGKIDGARRGGGGRGEGVKQRRDIQGMNIKLREKFIDKIEKRFNFFTET